MSCLKIMVDSDFVKWSALSHKQHKQIC